jgi:exosome complex component CSL4
MIYKMTVPTFALPGDSLATTSTHSPGPGSHVHNSTIHASLAGPVSSPAPSKKTRPLPTINMTPTSCSPSSTCYTAALPAVNDIILGRITRTNPRQATLDILALGPTGTVVLREPFSGIIRQQDIRATEIDKVKVSESFRVGDVVRGLVVSLGDERSYFVGTARNEFGVVLASSEAGVQMVPLSWREMREVGAGAGGGGGKVELRKVAKPV